MNSHVNNCTRQAWDSCRVQQNIPSYAELTAVQIKGDSEFFLRTLYGKLIQIYSLLTCIYILQVALCNVVGSWKTIICYCWVQDKKAESKK